jgi:hypothetical protein
MPDEIKPHNAALLASVQLHNIYASVSVYAEMEDPEGNNNDLWTYVQAACLAADTSRALVNLANAAALMGDSTGEIAYTNAIRELHQMMLKHKTAAA